MTKNRPGVMTQHEVEREAGYNVPLTPAEAAYEARIMLDAATEVMGRRAFKHIRFDQWEHPKTKVLVETGYTYGETRLTVHGPDGEVNDLRLTGRDPDEYRRFKSLAGI